MSIDPLAYRPTPRFTIDYAGMGLFRLALVPEPGERPRKLTLYLPVTSLRSVTETPDFHYSTVLFHGDERPTHLAMSIDFTLQVVEEALAANGGPRRDDDLP